MVFFQQGRSDFFLDQLLFEGDVKFTHAPGRLRPELVYERDELVKFERLAQRRRTGALAQEKQAVPGTRHRIGRVTAADLEAVDRSAGPG